ncbi:MAG TPA: dCTP deaminase [Longimicrobium sp.]
MGVLSKDQIQERLTAPLAERLVITPLLDRGAQISGASIDLRLGTEFIVLTRNQSPEINPAAEDYEAEVRKMIRRLHVPLGGDFVLHPRQFMLGSTLEYLRFPPNLMGYVEGRSSWGRTGLVIATATVVSPGYAGVLTFEIANVGELPVRLHSGTRIAQIVIHAVEPPSDSANDDHVTEVGPRYVTHKEAKFRIPTGPELGRLDTDADWALLERYRTRFNK